MNLTATEKKFYSISSFTDLFNLRGKVYVSAMPGSSRTLLAKKLHDKHAQIVLLCTTQQEVNETRVELSILGSEKEVIALDQLSKDSLQERLTDLTNREEFIFITTYKIFNTALPSPKDVKKSTTYLEPGGEITYDELIEYLSLLNFNRDKYIDTPGDFAVRGSIIDFWSFSEKQPVRVEFDGDFLESIRYFDPDTQRSLGRANKVSLASGFESEETFDSDFFGYFTEPVIIASDFELNELFKNEDRTISDDGTPLPEDEELKKELFDGNQKSEPKKKPLHKPAFTNRIDFENAASIWIIEDILGAYKNRIQLGLLETPNINSSFELLYKTISDYSNREYSVLLTAENDLQANRLKDLLSEYNEELFELIETEKVTFDILPIKKGFLSKEEKLIVLTDYQIFNKPYRSKLSQKYKQKKSRVKEFASIKHGDYVVHETFGIGRYLGLETIKIGMTEQESIKIQYADGGMVYVNLNYLSLVKKFSSKENSSPRLSVLGSNEWKNTKKKVKAKIKTAARELIKLYAKRKASIGYRFAEDTIWQKELEASFFYEDTPDQAKVTSEVKSDMETDHPMDRLVCGDVGFGKTEVAVRAAFKAMNDGKQVALLVPTTILAEQHYNTFKARLAQFPVKLAALSRFQTKKEQTEIIKKLVEGNIDIIIGTHRLISKDIKFKDLGLLIIDEEHRFGVMAKEKLRAIKANVDTLALTATPIPRTLNLSLLGARDLSIIATPPPNRQPIYTKVDVFEIAKIREWVLEEIKREGQIYFVHDRVQTIEKISAYLKKHIPELNIGVAHGQMKPTQLEKVIHDFLAKKYHMLVATKIIESGLDIPNVNTIIVNRADRFGLAELHQLRGRVGRSDRQAYAYLLVPSINAITQKAVKRLQAIEEYTELGEGFSLSMRDLEIRGAGNLLGTEQSGFIDSVGFDMYMKMLDEAVSELKEQEFKEVFKELPKHYDRSEPTIDTYFEIGIPKSFMPDQSDRLSYYTALFSMKELDEELEIRDEMEDKFGRLPVTVERMISTAILRYWAAICLFERVVITRQKISIILPKPEREEFYKEKFSLLMQYVMENYHNSVQFKQGKENMKMEMINNDNSSEQTLAKLIDFHKDIFHKVIDSEIEIHAES